jgi:8-amino-7-oxononanoate synthase
VEGRDLVVLCSNGYLGLADDPRVVAAAGAAAVHFGAGATASRLVNGTQALHRELEERLAALKGTEDAVVFSSGYLANVGVLGALAGRGDLIVSDGANHASIIDGCRVSRAEVAVYRHGDADHAAALLADGRRPGRRLVLVTDSVFSMDGDVAPLPALRAACDASGAALVVDEAHATGVLGPGGAGALAAAGVRADAVVGTLSKALGAQGGFVAGSASLGEWLRNRARTYAFDTALAPPAAGAALAALHVAEDEPWRRERALDHARRLAAGLARRGWRVGEPAACVVPVIVGEVDGAMAVSQRLRDAGILAPAIRPPTVPDGTSRIRCTTMASHSDADIAAALAAFGEAPRRRVAA